MFSVKFHQDKINGIFHIILRINIYVNINNISRKHKYFLNVLHISDS